MEDEFDQKKVLEIFPEINKIQSKDIRDKTVNVWEHILDKNDLDISDIYDIPASIHLDRSINLVQHTRAVTLTAIQAIEIYEEIYVDITHTTDLDIIIAGAILHDAGKVLEYKEDDGTWGKSLSGEYLRHPFMGVSICEKYNIPIEIQHIIATHSHEGNYYQRTTEAQIVYYADWLNFEPLQ